MNNPSLSQNDKITEPTLADLLQLLKKDIFLSMNCHALATVQSFDPAKQTVQATVNYKRTYSQRSPDGTYHDVLKDYPLMLDVPVIIMSGGAASLTFPIAAGDTCLILFNDRDIDNWFQSGQIAPLASGRLHDFADGIALIGLRAGSAPLDEYDSEHAGIRWNDVRIQASDSKILLKNGGDSLNDILQDLITAIENLTVLCATPGNPSGPPVNIADFVTIGTRLGDLLE